MAFDSALHFLDELKDKYIHEVEKAIEDWDYQDFSPDKRTPLLENEISGDVADDLAPETNALQQIKDASALNWAGISRDQMIADQSFGRQSITSGGSSAASFEARVVIMATPAGGVQGIPDSDAVQRFLQHAATMNAPAVAEAFGSRLQHTTWQIRAKALVLMEMLLESPDLVAGYLAAFLANASLLQVVEVIRKQDHNAIARENARKVSSLLRTSGANPNAIAREPIVHKPHVRHTPVDKTKKKPVSTAMGPAKQKLSVQTATATVGSPTKKTAQQAAHASSPKIAAAALASWKRRSQKELLGPQMQIVAPPPPAPESPSARTSSMALQKSGSSRSGFAFEGQPPMQQQQQRVSITMSRTHSFR